MGRQTARQPPQQNKGDVSISGERIRVEIPMGPVRGIGEVDPRDPFGNSQSGVGFDVGVGKGEVTIGADGLAIGGEVGIGGGKSKGGKSGAAGGSRKDALSPSGGIDLRKNSGGVQNAASPELTVSAGLKISAGALTGNGGSVTLEAGVSIPGASAGIETEIDTDLCTITVTITVMGMAFPHTYKNPKCDETPSPSPSPGPAPSPNPSPSPSPSNDLDLDQVGNDCTVFAAWIGKGYELEYYCYLYAKGGDGADNYYWNVARRSSSLSRGSPIAETGVKNPGSPNPEWGFIKITNGSENAGEPDAWMVNIGSFTDGARMIRSDYSKPAKDSWFVEGLFGQVGSIVGSKDQVSAGASLLRSQYASVEFSVFVKCPDSPPDEPPRPLTGNSSGSPPYNPPPKNMEDKCCNATTSMVRKIMKVLDIEKIEKEGFTVENRLLVAEGKGVSQAKTYPTIYQLMMRMMAHGMIFSPKVQIKDADSAKAGKQEMTMKCINATGWAQSIAEMVYEIMDDGNVSTNMEIRTGFAATQTMVAVVDCVRKLDAVLDALGVQLKQRREMVSTPYDLTLGNKGFDEKKGQLDLKNDEATEALLPVFLNSKENPLKTVELHPNAESIVEILMDIKKMLSNKGTS